jgi:4-diphosphocytidyl-2-C-methyl-D-erythritol kinase
MKHSIRVLAPAKINLHLSIGLRRLDGYHDIISLFQAIDLCDELTLVLNDSGAISLDCAVDCPVQQNTMFRAAAYWLDAARERGLATDIGLDIQAGKVIPTAAGLGGGSSDAAAVIKALDTLLPGYVPQAEQRRLAARVGSDVPFFMEGPCAVVSGRGELIQAIPPRTDYSVLVVDPGFPVSTALAYQWLDAARSMASPATGGHLAEKDHRMAGGRATPGYGNTAAIDRQALASLYQGCDPHIWPFQNDFFPVLATHHGTLATILTALQANGAAFAAMSGSGSALFGIFTDLEMAETARNGLIQDRLNAILSFPLARLPESH